MEEGNESCMVPLTLQQQTVVLDFNVSCHKQQGVHHDLVPNPTVLSLLVIM